MTSDILEDLDSLTVTIALETDYHQVNYLEGPSKQSKDTLQNTLNSSVTGEDELPPDFFRIGPPTKASEVYMEVDSQLQLANLTPSLVKQLELRLNPCALGTLKNWEYVCASLGASTDEIANLRRVESPTMTFLHLYKAINLNQFLKILASSNRIDVLITIQKSLLELKPPVQHQNVRIPLNEQMTNTMDSGIHFMGTLQNFAQIINGPQQYILVLHHEFRESKELRKCFRWLIHNLKDKCPSDFSILDINSCYDEQNLYGTIQKIFEKADQILLVASEDYEIDVLKKGPLETSDYKIKVKYFLHELMNNEYLRNGMLNRRFRIVVPDGTNPKVIPIGWPTNTIQYAFPQDFNELCKRLFINENTQ